MQEVFEAAGHLCILLPEVTRFLVLFNSAFSLLSLF